MATGYAPLTGFAPDRGDLLIKKRYNKDPVSHGIQTAQAVVKGTRYANYVHAAIALNGDLLAEAQGEGVVVHELKDNVGHGYKYKVFRYKDPELAAAAAEFAEEQVSRKPGYSYSKAFLSLFRKRQPKTGEKMTLLGDNTMFCSEFTTACYNRAAYARELPPIIPFGAEDANPGALYGYLKQSANWKMVGEIP